MLMLIDTRLLYTRGYYCIVLYPLSVYDAVIGSGSPFVGISRSYDLLRTCYDDR